MRTTVSTITLTLLAGLMVPLNGCGSQASTICTLECDCEHCNDYEESITCIGRENEADVAQIYGCETEWQTWATCYEEKGECDEKEANYSTTSPGRCNGTAPLGVPCMTDTDCDFVGFNASCVAGDCTDTVCSGGAGFPCVSDSDCDGLGADRCDDERSDLNECIDKASEHGGPGVDIN